MTKFETVQYLANLLAVMESKERAGLRRGKTITAEYARVYDTLMETLRKEEEHEARKS